MTAPAAQAPTPIVEGFSLSHAQILDGVTTFLDTAFADYDQALDIYGVNEGSLEPDSDQYENEGDDDVLSRWNWLNFAEVAITGGYVSFPLMATITGRAYDTIEDNTATPGPYPQRDVYAADLWHEDDSNVADRPMILKMPSKDTRGATRDLIIGLYRVSFGPITFEGPSYKEGLKVNYNGTALKTLYDEVGTAFPDGKKRAGRLLSVGPAKPTVV